MAKRKKKFRRIIWEQAFLAEKAEDWIKALLTLGVISEGIFGIEHSFSISLIFALGWLICILAIYGLGRENRIPFRLFMIGIFVMEGILVLAGSSIAFFYGDAFKADYGEGAWLALLFSVGAMAFAWVAMSYLPWYIPKKSGCGGCCRCRG